MRPRGAGLFRLHFEDQVLHILFQFDLGGDDLRRKAQEINLGGPGEWLVDRYVAHEFGLLPLLDGRPLHVELQIGRGDLEIRQLRRGVGGPVHVGRTEREDLPLLHLGAAVGIERKQDFILPFRNVDRRDAADPRRKERHLHVDRFRKALFAMSANLQLHRAALHQGNLRLHDLQRVGQLLDDHNRHPIDVAPAIQRLARRADDELCVVEESAADLLLRIVETCLEIDKSARQRSVRRRLEDDRHRAGVGGHRIGDDLHSFGHSLGVDHQFAAAVLARRRHERPEPVAASHINLLPQLRIAGDLRQAGRDLRLDRQEFHAVNKARPAAEQVVVDGEEILAVGRNRETEIGVGAAGVVVGSDPLPGRVVQHHHRIDRRAEPPAEAFDFVRFAFLRLEFEVIDVAGSLQNAVEGQRQLGRRGLFDRVVRLLLQNVSMLREPERNPGRSGAGRVFRNEFEVGNLLAGELDLFHDVARRIAEEPYLDLVAQLASRGINGDRPRERADVQAVVRVSIPPVGTFADLDVILAVGRRDDRGGRVLLQEGRIVGGDELEPLRIENGDIRVEHCDAEPHALDLGADPLSFLRIDHEIIDVFRLDDSVDRHVEGNGLRSGELGVGLFFLNLAKRADVKRPVLGYAARGSHVGHVLAQPAVRRDLDRRLHGAGDSVRAWSL